MLARCRRHSTPHQHYTVLYHITNATSRSSDLENDSFIFFVHRAYCSLRAGLIREGQREREGEGGEGGSIEMGRKKGGTEGVLCSTCTLRKPERADTYIHTRVMYLQGKTCDFETQGRFTICSSTSPPSRLPLLPSYSFPARSSHRCVWLPLLVHLCYCMACLCLCSEMFVVAAAACLSCLDLGVHEERLQSLCVVPLSSLLCI